MKYEDITLVLGVDGKHLNELRFVWPSWMRFKPELKRMPCILFYDALQVKPEETEFLNEHPCVRLVPWGMTNAENQREKMLTGFVKVPALEVQTPWYLKIDTDVIATAPGEWIKDEWFFPDEHGRIPVFIASSWAYTKPANLMALLDDWADGVSQLAKKPRLNLPYGAQDSVLSHQRITSWLFFGRTDWTRKVAALLGPEGRMPYPSQDSFMFYCAKRLRCRYVRARMKEHGWDHRRVRLLRLEQAIDREKTGGNQRGERGVVYYNRGTGCAVRLLVSLTSLRKHYSGPITILSEGDESHPLCEQIGKTLDVNVAKWEPGVPAGKNAAFLAKTRLNQGTPYEVTVAIDSDTLILGPIDELFEAAENGTFCVAHFANRRTTGGVLSRRLRRWADVAPNDLDAALEFGPAINTGVMAFTKNASIFEEWYTMAEKGRHHFIPDEVSCQLMLYRHKHQVLDGRWNRSCKHDNPDLPDTRIIHYHGKKHCREGLPFHGKKWVMAFQEICWQNRADVRSWAPAGDLRLQKYLSAHPLKRSAGPNSRIILGAGRTVYEGWQSTERNVLDVTKEDDFIRMLRDKPAERFLAEHVWEHLPDDALKAANALTFKYLQPGGCLRLAVPDGLHPDPAYLDRVKPNGSGPSASDHRQLFTHATLAESLESVGFVVKKLEYWNEEGDFISRTWNPLDGHIKRSANHDRRNRNRKLSYTSLIVDACKPAESLAGIDALDRGINGDSSKKHRLVDGGKTKHEPLAKRIYQGGTRGATHERIDALRLHFQPAETVLDLGCNQGEFCTLLNEAGMRATGVDRSPPDSPGFLKIDLNRGMSAFFELLGIEQFDHVLVLSVWKYIKISTIVDLISYYTKKSVTIEFNPRIHMSKDEVQELFKKSELVVDEMWKTTDRFERQVVRLINRKSTPPRPAHIVQNEKTGKPLRHEPDLTLSLDDIRNGRHGVLPGTVIMMKRKELLSLRNRYWKPFTSWWRDAWMGRPLTGAEKMAWLRRSCQDGWDWRRPAHLSYSRSERRFRLVNGFHRIEACQSELVPVLISYSS